MRAVNGANCLMEDEGPRYAIYFVPAPDSDLYRFGSSVLGYDCYTGEALTRSADFGLDAQVWNKITEEPRRYGFHATLKAPFFLSPACTEAQLVSAVYNFAELGHVIPAITPVIQILSGFAAIVPQQSEPSLDSLPAHCTMIFDSFRAPMSPQERARWIALGLGQGEVENLDRWGYPYLFAHFRFHMTLTSRVEAHQREKIIALLRESFQRRCGMQPIPIDRLALLKQNSRHSSFRVIAHIKLRAIR